jgi:hypothetical protein
MLPEDGTAHLFNKVGERLDMSHVQISKFYEVAEYAVWVALQTVAHESRTQKFYAREEGGMISALRWKPNIQTAATRASIPLLGTIPQPEIIRGNQPVTVGPSNPEVREREAVGFVSGTYTATTKYDFTRVRVPIDGRYKIRMKTYTFLAGPNGASGGNDHGLTGGDKAWWRPSRTVWAREKRIRLHSDLIPPIDRHSHPGKVVLGRRCICPGNKADCLSLAHLGIRWPHGHGLVTPNYFWLWNGAE